MAAERATADASVAEAFLAATVGGEASGAASKPARHRARCACRDDRRTRASLPNGVTTTPTAAPCRRAVRIHRTSNMIKPTLTVLAACLMGASCTSGHIEDPIQPVRTALDSAPAAPEFQGLTDWINSEPLRLAQLRGRVVLVEFWTYG